jgi:hypothetical protein
LSLNPPLPTDAPLLLFAVAEDEEDEEEDDEDEEKPVPTFAPRLLL